MLSTSQADHLYELVKDFPQLGGDKSLSEHGVDYEQFYDASGYTIQIFKDPRAYVGYGQAGPEFPYYWYLPELKVRSTDLNAKQQEPEMAEVVKLVWSPSGTFRYRTVQEAADAAEKYLDYVFPQEPESVQ